MNIEELQSLQERVKKLEKSIVEKMSTMQKNIAFISIFQKILNIILICAIAGFIFVYKYDIIPLMHEDKHEIIKEINDLEDEIKSSK